jgi:uncharacterized membrane protein
MWVMTLRLAQDSAAAVNDNVGNFFGSGSPTSPFKIYLLVMFILWLLARRGRKKETFSKQAQEVLDEKFTSGEITKKTYDKFRQDVTIRPKR